MWPDGICRVTDTFYTKTIEYQDINYQLSQNEDKTAIFEGWCDFLNYFDSSIQFQLSFLNLAASRNSFSKSIAIPPQGDGFDHIRAEYTEMLQNQLAKGNNGLVKTKYLTFGIEAENVRAAKPRLERIETDVINNFKRLGVACEPMDGKGRLRLMHDIFRMDEQEPFHFSWGWLAPSGLSTKDFIAPSSFEFKTGKAFCMGRTFGAVSFVQILAPELNDRMLADFLDMESSLVVNLHIQSVDQVRAIKTVKRKITDLDRAKIEEQKKAVRAGYDMDIIPSDLATYGTEAKKLLQDLQSRNERMFLVTFLVLNTAESRRQLDNNVFQASSIAQKHNCQLTRLDFQQEEGLMSSLPLGRNLIPIQRSLTTSSVAIFVPFTTQELFQDGPEALYYGLNALSNNLIMVDRKLLKNPNGLILGTPGCFAGDTHIRLADGTAPSFAELVERGVTECAVKAYNEDTGQIVDARAKEIRIEKYVDTLAVLELEDGTSLSCTHTHLIMDAGGEYVRAGEIQEGQHLSSGHTVVRVSVKKYTEKVPVYDMTVPQHLNFLLENGLIVHNSGKSFSAKREISNVMLVTHDDILICDPEDEYTSLVEHFGREGQVVKISPTSTQYVNPMDINLNYSDDDNPLALKADFLLSLCDIVVGNKDGLQPIEKTVIDRSVRNVYRPYLANPDPEKMPILQDLYDELLKQPEPEAKRIAAALELYVSGSLNVFNHRTNVVLEKRLVCFNIKELGKQLKQLGMLIIQDQVWNRVTVNRARKRTTRYYVDEFHLLLKGELAAWSVEIWKRFRKWGGIPTGGLACPCIAA